MKSNTASQGTWLQHPLPQLVLARLKEFWREPAAIFWVYGFPLIMIMALGIAFRHKPAEFIAVDIQNGPKASETQSLLSSNEQFKVAIFDADQCRTRLRIGQSDLTLVIREDATYEFLLDPTKPGSALARNNLNDVLQRAAGRKDVFLPEVREIVEPGGRYIDFLVPGLLGMGLLGGGMWGVGFALVDLRIRKLLKRFAATPMKQSHFMMGLMISRLLFMIPEVLVILVFSRLFFGVVNHGSYLAVFFLMLLGAFQFAGLGLLVASRAQKLETASGLMNLVMMPMWIGSGVFFSAERFPDAIQPAIQALPLTPLINAMRAVINEGTHLSALLPELGILSGWTIVSFVLALKFFRWR